MLQKIITAAYPYIPVELNLSHMASTYIPADIYRRLSRYYDEPAMFLTGIDVHGKHVQRKAEELKKPPEELVERFIENYKEDFAWLSIQPDTIIRTDDIKIKVLMDKIFSNLISSRLVARIESKEVYCDNCSEYLSKSEIYSSDEKKRSAKGSSFLESIDTNLVCALCSRDETRIIENHQWSLLLERERYLTDILERQPSKSTQKLLNDIYNSTFTLWTFTRRDYYGFTTPFDASRQLYLWCDSLISKLLPLEEIVQHQKSESSMPIYIAFMGKNILPYYGLVFPILMRHGLNIDDPKIIYSVRGFAKADYSDKILNIHSRRIFPDLLRFYCAYTVPDKAKDFILSEDWFKTTTNSILIDTFGKFLSGSIGYLTKLENLPEKVERVQTLEGTLRQCYNDVSPRRILLTLEQAVKSHTKKIRSSCPESANETLNLYILTYNILSCIIPTMIKDYKIFPTDQYGFIRSPGKISIPSKNVKWERIQ